MFNNNVVNWDGKKSFVGCSRYMHGNRRSHRFVSILKEVNEGHVKELLTCGDKSLKTLINTKACAHVSSACSGLNGDRKCSELLSSCFLRLFLTHTLIEYSHIKDGKVVQGRLMQRKCPTIIQIYSPVDRSDRHIIVILRGAQSPYACCTQTLVRWEG